MTSRRKRHLTLAATGSAAALTLTSLVAASPPAGAVSGTLAYDCTAVSGPGVFTAVIDTNTINEVNVRSLMDIAGRSVGLCDFRPGCRGPFGCSKVTSWTRIDESDGAATKAKSNGHADKELVSAS